MNPRAGKLEFMTTGVDLVGDPRSGGFSILNRSMFVGSAKHFLPRISDCFSRIGLSLGMVRPASRPVHFCRARAGIPAHRMMDKDGHWNKRWKGNREPENMAQEKPKQENLN